MDLSRHREQAPRIGGSRISRHSTRRKALRPLVRRHWPQQSRAKSGCSRLAGRTARRLAAPRSLRSAWCQSSRRPISGADQSRWRSARLKNAGALTSRLRVILCAGWPGRPTNDARRKPQGSWLVNGRPRSGRAIEVFSSGTTEMDHSDVSAGCDQTGPGAGQA